MGVTFPYNLANGNTADADEVMANFNEINNNLDTDTIDDASANLVAMQVKADPYPGETPSLPTDLRGEIQRLRYQLNAIIGKTDWYEDSDTNLLLEFNKGADIASATALALGVDGNYFDVTDTNAITSIGTRRVGSIVKLHFDGILTLTHDATDLILPGSAHITTAAGDEAEFVEYATGDWRCTRYTKATGKAIIESVSDLHDHTGGAGAVIPQAGIDSAAIGRGELKTATGSVSNSVGVNTPLTLPGGEYGFYPQVKSADMDGCAIVLALNQTIAAYTAVISPTSNTVTAFAQQRYIQSSPPYKIGGNKWGHFLYLLVNSQGDVLSSYEAEDPPYAYNGPTHNKKDSIDRIQAVPHPFANYWDRNPALDGVEIVLIDLRGHNTKKWKADNAKKGKEILEDLGSINKKGKIVTPKELGIVDIRGFTDKVKIRKHN